MAEAANSDQGEMGPPGPGTEGVSEPAASPPVTTQPVGDTTTGAGTIIQSQEGSTLPAPTTKWLDTGTIVAATVVLVGVAAVTWIKSRSPLTRQAGAGKSLGKHELILAKMAERIEALEARVEELEAERQPAGPGCSPTAAAIIEPRGGQPISDDPFSRRVYELADSGMAPVDIARSLEEQTGKIELVLALRRAAAAR